MPSISLALRSAPLAALAVVIALLLAPRPANAAACLGADPCPWTHVDAFGAPGHGEFRAPYGAATDADGNLYVVENDVNHVQKLDPTGAFLDEWGSTGTAEGQLRWAYDIAVDATHAAVYVADSGNDRIEKFDTSGNFVAAWGWGVDDGANAFQVCTSSCREGIAGAGKGQFSGLRGIATDGAHVYVTEWGNSRVQKFALDGSFVRAWTVGSPPQKPQRIAVAGGKVYVTTYSNMVWRFGTSGSPDPTWDGDGRVGTGGDGGGQFDYPVGIAVDGTGVYVVDSSNSRIEKLDLSGGFVSTWGWGVDDGAAALQTCTSTCRAGISGAGAGQFDDPYGILVTGGKVWVADSYNHRFQQFTTAGAHKKTLGGLPGGEFYYPNDVAIAPSGDVYVADYSAPRVQRLSSTGAFLNMWTTPYPLSVTPTANGVYTTSGNFVRRFDATGAELGQWGGSGAGPGQLNWASESTSDAAGNIYVADRENNRIQKFGPTGSFLAQFGSAGSGNGQLNRPRDVAVDPAGNVYVADTGNNRIEKFDAAGGFLTAWGSAGNGPGQFAAPGAVAVDARGDVFVSDIYNDRIQRFDTNGHFISAWGERGTGDGQLQYPSGLAVDAAGAVWVADNENHRIVRFCCPAERAPDSGNPTPPATGPESGPAADSVPPRIALTGRRVQRAAGVRRRGLAIRIRSDEATRFELTASLGRKSARALKLGTGAALVARKGTDLAAAGARSLRMKLTARARRALARTGTRRIRLVVRASAVDRSGNRAGASMVIRIRP